MVEERYEPGWRTLAEERECGSCYACCVWLGIEALKKWTGQTCKHLCGGDDPSKRCTIYDERPKACAEYHCMWREGYGPDELQPNRSGILLTPYDSTFNPGKTAVTAIVFDEKLAEPLVERLIRELASLDVELRLVNFKKRTALLFHNGSIYQCRLLRPDNYESLNFEAHEPPIGKYRIERETHGNMGSAAPSA